MELVFQEDDISYFTNGGSKMFGHVL